MPFVKGNQLGKANLGRKKESKKTIWLMESLAEHGYNYEAMLVSFLQKAAKGDRLALDMAHLLVKLVPHMANAPKQDVGINQIETLVINRYAIVPADTSSTTPDVINRFDDCDRSRMSGPQAPEAVKESQPAIETTIAPEDNH